MNALDVYIYGTLKYVMLMPIQTRIINSTLMKRWMLFIQCFNGNFITLQVCEIIDFHEQQHSQMEIFIYIIITTDN